MALYSKILATDACKLLDCQPNKKAFEMRYPSDIIPEQFESHFVRAVFEGDGSISVNNSNGVFNLTFVCSSEQFLLGLKKCISKNCFENKDVGSIRVDKSARQLCYYSQTNVAAVLDWMYSSLTFDAYNYKSYHVKKYQRYLCFKRINGLNIDKRKDAIKLFLIKEHENEERILQNLCDTCVGIQPNVMDLNFRKSFEKFAANRVKPKDYVTK